MSTSPSDPSGFAECLHLTGLEREVAEGRRSRPQGRSAYGNPIARKGDEHEAAFLARLRAQGTDAKRSDLGRLPLKLVHPQCKDVGREGGRHGASTAHPGADHRQTAGVRSSLGAGTVGGAGSQGTGGDGGRMLLAERGCGGMRAAQVMLLKR